MSDDIHRVTPPANWNLVEIANKVALEAKIAKRLWLASQFWELHLLMFNTGEHNLAVQAYRAHFDAMERVAKAQRPDLWEAKP